MQEVMKMNDIPFQFVGLRFKCEDCYKGVGDRNGILVIRQMEAHLKNYPDHTVEMERTGLDDRRYNDE